MRNENNHEKKFREITCFPFEIALLFYIPYFVFMSNEWG